MTSEAIGQGRVHHSGGADGAGEPALGIAADPRSAAHARPPRRRRPPRPRPGRIYVRTFFAAFLTFLPLCLTSALPWSALPSASSRFLPVTFPAASFTFPLAFSPVCLAFLSVAIAAPSSVGRSRRSADSMECPTSRKHNHNVSTRRRGIRTARSRSGGRPRRHPIRLEGKTCPLPCFGKVSARHLGGLDHASVRQEAMRSRSGVNPWATPQRTAWVRLATSILR